VLGHVQLELPRTTCHVTACRIDCQEQSQISRQSVKISIRASLRAQWR